MAECQVLACVFSEILAPIDLISVGSKLIFVSAVTYHLNWVLIEIEFAVDVISA